MAGLAGGRQPSQEDTLGEAQELGQRKRYLSNSAGDAQRSRTAHLRGAAPAGEPGDARGPVRSEFGVSRERIRQIEVRAFEKVQKAVQSRPRTSKSTSPTESGRHFEKPLQV